MIKDILWAFFKDLSICQNLRREGEKQEKIDVYAFDFRLLRIIAQI